MNAPIQFKYEQFLQTIQLSNNKDISKYERRIKSLNFYLKRTIRYTLPEVTSAELLQELNKVSADVDMSLEYVPPNSFDDLFMAYSIRNKLIIKFQQLAKQMPQFGSTFSNKKSNKSIKRTSSGNNIKSRKNSIEDGKKKEINEEQKEGDEKTEETIKDEENENIKTEETIKDVESDKDKTEEIVKDVESEEKDKAEEVVENIENEKENGKTEEIAQNIENEEKENVKAEENVESENNENESNEEETKENNVNEENDKQTIQEEEEKKEMETEEKVEEKTEEHKNETKEEIENVNSEEEKDEKLEEEEEEENEIITSEEQVKSEDKTSENETEHEEEETTNEAEHKEEITIDETQQNETEAEAEHEEENETKSEEKEISKEEETEHEAKQENEINSEETESEPKEESNETNTEETEFESKDESNETKCEEKETNHEEVQSAEEEHETKHEEEDKKESVEDESNSELLHINNDNDNEEEEDIDAELLKHKYDFRDFDVFVQFFFISLQQGGKIDKKSFIVIRCACIRVLFDIYYADNDNIMLSEPCTPDFIKKCEIAQQLTPSQLSISSEIFGDLYKNVPMWKISSGTQPFFEASDHIFMAQLMINPLDIAAKMFQAMKSLERAAKGFAYTTQKQKGKDVGLDVIDLSFDDLFSMLIPAFTLRPFVCPDAIKRFLSLFADLKISATLDYAKVSTCALIDHVEEIEIK
ncbi:hypothetical protein GPJ56_006686 [Histomonas meleagridis]|uniref:uncharacterized protein n=1 Tax=Histomonas meleagridis TaxID=135588 RepID=UPI0035598E08|nr:hypothetical protein GPJ56_006686 [Histomonas meleagridis]KAH0805971.1 hypothetical protein GO595_001219 [Histomonas meleagridis]